MFFVSLLRCALRPHCLPFLTTFGCRNKLDNNVNILNGLGECPALLASYIDNRRMYVCNGSARSDYATASRGVPQGSVLAPLLFNLYFSDVTNCFPSRDVILYADDTAIICSSSDLLTTRELLQANLRNLEKFLSSKMMKLNASKTYYMLFCAPAALANTTLKSDIGEVKSTYSFKYLGVHLDSDLSFEIHCNHLISKVKSQCYMLLRYPRKRNWQERRVLFYAHIYPLFLYAIECYMHCSVLLRERLERVYRKCGKIVLGESCLSDSSVYAKLETLPLRLLFQLRGATLMFRIVRLNQIRTFSDYFVSNTASNRRALDLLLPRLPSERYRKSFRYWGAKLWNSIPGHIRSARSVTAFESSYECHLKGKINCCTSDAYNLYDFI